MPRYYRKVIRIRGHDSPNVRLAEAEIASGKKSSGRILCPGVLTYDELHKRLRTWDKVRICIGIEGMFYEGAEVLLYPPEWLNESERRADSLIGRKRIAKAMGVDTAEGGDSSVWSIIDELGLIYMLSMKTPDTSVVTSRTIALMNQYDIEPEMVNFDRGGGGKEHADRLQLQGYRVQTTGFGEAPSLDPKRGMYTTETRKDIKAERSAFKNRRAEMYGILRNLIDPSLVNEEYSGIVRSGVFAIPVEYTELRRQLSPIPLWHDEEGRMYLPPKRRKTGDKDRDDKSKTITLDDLIGCSPDEADSLVLATFALYRKSFIAVAGGF